MELKKQPYLKLNLQKFAEGGETDPPNTGEEEKPKYTDKDVDELFNKKFAKLKKQFDEELEKRLEASKTEQAEAERLAKMNAEEKIAFERKKLEAENAELRRINQYNELSKEATKMLVEKKLVPTEGLLRLLVRDTAEETQKAVNVYVESVTEQVKDQVKEALTGTPPTANIQKSTVVNPFSAATFNLTKQAELLKTNPDLYKQLKAQAD